MPEKRCAVIKERVKVEKCFKVEGWTDCFDSWGALELEKFDENKGLLRARRERGRESQCQAGLLMTAETNKRCSGKIRRTRLRLLQDNY